MATGKLDHGSRKTLARVVARLAALALYVAWVRVAGFASGPAALQLLRLGCIVSAAIAVVHGLRAGERAGRGGLNRWDEAAAYGVVGLAAHLANHGAAMP